MITKKIGESIKRWTRLLFGVAIMIWPPIIGVACVPIWPDRFGFFPYLGFLLFCLAVFFPWIFLLHVSGFLRWQLYRVWRPGTRPCMCDQPTYCFKHESPRNEPNRPGLIEVKLREES
jgi:hypothetical protein